MDRRLPTLIYKFVSHEAAGRRIGHTGEPRSFLGHTGVAFARQVLPLMTRRFFADIPEAEVILDVDQMTQEAPTFDYSDIDRAMTECARIPALVPSLVRG